MRRFPRMIVRRKRPDRSGFYSGQTYEPLRACSIASRVSPRFLLSPRLLPPPELSTGRCHHHETSRTATTFLSCWRKWIRTAGSPVDTLSTAILTDTATTADYSRHSSSSATVRSSANNTFCSMAHDDAGHVTRVLFCGPHFPASHDYTIEYLKGYPYVQVDVVPLDEVADVIENYHLCVVKNKRLDSDLVARANQMKLIMQYGVGLEERNGIGCPTKATGSASRGNTFWSSFLGMVILVLISHHVCGHLVSKSWQQNGTGAVIHSIPPAAMVFGEHIILQCPLASHGNFLGTSCLRKCCHIVSSGKLSMSSLTLDAGVDKKGVENLYEFAGDADIVAVCMALDDETVGIVDNKFLSSMIKGAILVNVARGGLLDYEAVKSSLESGHLGGLGIDVAWTEPFDPDDAILKRSNVLITPHIAGVTEYSYRSMAKVVGDCALQLHAGTPLAGIEFVN